MGWNISYPLAGEQWIEIRPYDPSKEYKISWDVIELDERGWREFLEEVREVGKVLGWEE